MKDITVTLTEDEWAVVVRGLQRGISGYADDKKHIADIIVSNNFGREASVELFGVLHGNDMKLNETEAVRNKIANIVFPF